MGLPLQMSRIEDYLVFVPARGGPKGTPGKNLQPLCGKPLIPYTLETVAGLGLVEQTVVSADDAKRISV